MNNPKTTTKEQMRLNTFKVNLKKVVMIPTVQVTFGKDNEHSFAVPEPFGSQVVQTSTENILLREILFDKYDLMPEQINELLDLKVEEKKVEILKDQFDDKEEYSEENIMLLIDTHLTNFEVKKIQHLKADFNVEIDYLGFDINAIIENHFGEIKT